jgi:CspA family cold shock protein
MSEGVIKWFSDAKGIGFIQPDEGGADVFVHFSAIMMDGFKTVRPGQRVRYELMDGPKGAFAANIQSASATEPITVQA